MSHASRTTDKSHEALKQAVFDAMKMAQDACLAYMNVSKERPYFYMDGALRALPQDLVQGATLLASRSEYLASRNKGGIVCEVGTLYGNFAREILQTCCPDALHIVDLSLGNVTAENRRFLNDSGCHYHVGKSWEQLSSFPDRYFDMIYIDACHSYEAVALDLAQAVRVVKAGGEIVCNDYTLFDPWNFVPYGVVQATNECMIKHRIRMKHFVLQVSGYYDVVLTNN